MKILDAQIADGVHALIQVVDAKLQVVLSGDAEAVGKKVKEMIPGSIDDAVIDAAIAILKKMTESPSA